MVKFMTDIEGIEEKAKKIAEMVWEAELWAEL